MNVYDKHFRPVVGPFIGQTIVLADFGFRAKVGAPKDMKICKKGTWNERMCVETVLSLLTTTCDLKSILHQLSKYIQGRLAYVVAMFNILLDLFHKLHPEADLFKIVSLSFRSKLAANRQYIPDTKGGFYRQFVPDKFVGGL